MSTLLAYCDRFSLERLYIDFEKCPWKTFGGEHSTFSTKTAVVWNLSTPFSLHNRAAMCELRNQSILSDFWIEDRLIYHACLTRLWKVKSKNSCSQRQLIPMLKTYQCGSSDFRLTSLAMFMFLTRTIVNVGVWRREPHFTTGTFVIRWNNKQIDK